MLMTGISALTAAIPVPEAGAYPSGRDVPAGRVPPPAAPPGNAAQGTYLFHDEFDGPAGSPPIRRSGRCREPGSRWRTRRFGSYPKTSGSIATIAKMCSSTASPISSSAPQKTAAPITAAKCTARGKGGSAPPGKPGSNSTASLPVAGPPGGCPVMLRAKLTSSSGTATARGLREPPSTQKRTAPNGRLTSSRLTAGGTRGECNGMTPVCALEGLRRRRAAILQCSGAFHRGLAVQRPRLRVFPILNLAVAGSGGGDPGPGTYPAEMLVDWIRSGKHGAPARRFQHPRRRHPPGIGPITHTTSTGGTSRLRGRPKPGQRLPPRELCSGTR